MRVPSLLNRLKNILCLLMFISGLILIGVSWRARAGEFSACYWGCYQLTCGAGRCMLDGPDSPTDGICKTGGPASGCCHEASGTCEYTGQLCIMQYCDDCALIE